MPTRPTPDQTISAAMRALEGAPLPSRAEDVDFHLRAIIERKDQVKLYEMAPYLSRLPAAELAVIKVRLADAFGRDFSKRDFSSAIRDAQRAAASPRPKLHEMPAREWRDALLTNQDGNAKALLANAITALRGAPEWDGVLAYNEFSLGTMALKPAPWDGAAAGEWTDHHDRLTANWMQHEGICVSVDVAGEAVQAVARDRTFNPVTDYLDSLRWDGTKRIDTWTSLYLGVEPTDYTAAVGARWLISAVARAYKPGTKVDHCLILEGDQGLQKSTALEILGGEWFTDEIADLGSKDAAMQACGVWIIEISELDGMSRADVGKVKAFMSRRTGRFRPPYGRRIGEYPRQCVFAGSANHNTYLRDETGGRRFWPVTCTRILTDDLARDRDKLWAEAVARYRGGAVWWLDSAELNTDAAEEQAARFEGDPWQEAIAAWIIAPEQRYDSMGHPVGALESEAGSVTIPDILTHCVGKRQDQWTQLDKNRVARCLRALRWVRFRARAGSGREWRYRPTE